MMMKRHVALPPALTAAFVLATLAGAGALDAGAPARAQDPPQRPTELSLVLTNPGSHPRVGVPDFAVTGDAALQAAARTLVEVLWNDLEFEREFYMIPRTSSAALAAVPVSGVPFERWAQLGADYVLLGSVRDAGGRLAVDVRLVAVKAEGAGRQEFASGYEGCTAANPRYCAHSIADDIHRKIRGLDGVARTRLAFTSDRDAGRMAGRLVEDSGLGKEIYIADYDGANQRRITANQSLNLAPSWGADTRTLIYTSYASHYPDIYLTLLDGRPPTRPGRGDDRIQNTLPSISPDGTKIAFASNRGTPGYFDVWVMNRDGSDVRNLTPNTAKSSESAPTWSPGGNQIAFTSDRTGSNQIYVMNADGTGLRRISFDQHCDRPTWSRLNYIAYTTGSGPGHDIAVIDLSTMQTRILTDGLGSNSSPTVAPNGRHIAFVTTRWGKEQVAIIDYPDGKNIRRVTEVGNNTYPNWSPAPGGR